MIAFPSLLIGPAEEAGIKVPHDVEKYNPEEYPHWYVFLNIQLGAPMPSPFAHWNNAKLIAQLSDKEVRTVTYQELIDRGLEVGNSG